MKIIRVILALKNIQKLKNMCFFVKTLLGSNDKITYIPSYIELLEGDLEEQIYVARFLKDNIDRIIVSCTAPPTAL